MDHPGGIVALLECPWRAKRIKAFKVLSRSAPRNSEARNITIARILKSCPKNFEVQGILFEIDCENFYTNLHELFGQFINWTNWVNSGKYMANCWISCQVMADLKKVYDDLIIINLYWEVPLQKEWGFRLIIETFYNRLSRRTTALH